MPYIVPSTNIRVLKNVPLSPDYEHTLYWPDRATQTSYFQGKTKYSFLNCTYTRPFNGKIRIERCADDLYDCNYLMFQNTNFGIKWFYGFITDVLYLSNNVSEITFQIDVMQTYYFDYMLDQCFVVREHTRDDTVGANLIPENLDTGEYIYDHAYRTGYLSAKSIVFAATFDYKYNPSPGMFVAGLFAGLHYSVFRDPDPSDVLDISAWISGAAARADGFVSAFYYPTDMMPANWDGPTVPEDIADPIYKTIPIPLKQSGAIDGYTPKNNKLYTYPYNFLYVTNGQGNSATYKYEFFKGTLLHPLQGNAPFILTGDFCPNPTMWLYPQYYKGSNQDETPLSPLYVGNYDEAISIGGWGQIPFATDTYRAWSAQHGTSLITGALSSALTGAMSGGAAGAAAGFARAAAPGVVESAVRGAIQTFNTEAAMPNQAHGTFSPMSQLALGIMDFWFYDKHITAEYAKVIDDYFTRYGYATNKIKVPEIHGRTHFTYTQTVGCTITPYNIGATASAPALGMPADAEAEICRIYNKGITFWVNPAEVGHYFGYQDNNAPIPVPSP